MYDRICIAKDGTNTIANIKIIFDNGDFLFPDKSNIDEAFQPTYANTTIKIVFKLETVKLKTDKLPSKKNKTKDTAT